MRRFKTVDVIIQGVLLLAIFFCTLKYPGKESKVFLASYLAISGWQLMSAIVHALIRFPNPAFMRKVYNWGLLIFVAFSICAAVLGWAILVALAWVMLTPCMAIFYWIVCIGETNRWRTRLSAEQQDRDTNPEAEQQVQ
ncbi:MAG: hypothetical protein P0Y53_08875 [Candidatus Pseudobacter hemicellulosilyticus]|uniref:Uncharacterized protein n=1 Tax=Candidatus Pseudobacter hemicellulosilyticus TaxID=3121375 RepID=A0AAJ5WUG5_9BACT|nr:MAG: hypothetical protein P0Y53_08875 [Pseudobacter sp.]